MDSVTFPGFCLYTHQAPADLLHGFDINYMAMNIINIEPCMYMLNKQSMSGSWSQPFDYTAQDNVHTGFYV